MAEAVKKRSKKVRKHVPHANMYIQSTYNNTIISCADQQGNVLAWGSSGQSGFKGAKKATPYAASIIVKSIFDKVKDFGIKQVDIFVKGVGSGRESAIRTIAQNGVTIQSIKDVTPTPHNGTRPPKPRRV